jgi:hypothetical protein
LFLTSLNVIFFRSREQGIGNREQGTGNREQIIGENYSSFFFLLNS